MLFIKHLWKSLNAALPEIGIVALILGVDCAFRLFAATHAGIEVDEPIYRYAAAFAAQYGFPSVRAAVGQSTIPFLYQPPFFLWLLGLWFKLWGSESYLTGRLFSVLCSVGMLGLIYAFVRIHIGKGVALLTLLFVGSDVWMIFTNQGIYIENSQMIFIILAMWAYWYATKVDSTNIKQYSLQYLLAGLLIGWAIVYKNIGVFLLVGVLANLAMQRKHWRGHVLLIVVALGVTAEYTLAMHAAFFSQFDSATVTQILRTLWGQQSPGLTYSPLTALQAIVTRYWIFPITILVLVGGSLLVVVRFLQHLLGKRKEEDPIVLGWALGGVVFALSISLKSPHYIILWLVPLYILVSKELYRVFVTRIDSRLSMLFQNLKHRLPSNLLASPTGRRKFTLSILMVGLLLVNIWSYQARFLHSPGDTLAQADAYINTHIPSSAWVLTEDYVGVDLTPKYVNINFDNTPAQIYMSDVTYAALYWSTTEPLPASLGSINQYCKPLKTFAGFKDYIEVCKVDRIALAALLASSHAIFSNQDEVSVHKH